VLGERVGLAVGHVAFAAKDLEIQTKYFIQFAVPVVHQPSGHDHQRAFQFPPARQLAEDQRCLYGLPEAHLIGDQEAPWAGCRHPVREHHLMRQKVDPCRGQRRSTLHQRQHIRLECQADRAKPLWCAHHIRQHTVGAR